MINVLKKLTFFPAKKPFNYNKWIYMYNKNQAYVYRNECQHFLHFMLMVYKRSTRSDEWFTYWSLNKCIGQPCRSRTKKRRLRSSWTINIPLHHKVRQNVLIRRIILKTCISSSAWKSLKCTSNNLLILKIYIISDFFQSV